MPERTVKTGSYFVGVPYAAVRLADPQRTRNALDKLIGAHALAVQATLVTANPADFSRIPGLQVENWAS